MAADLVMLFFPRPRVVCSISSSGVANATETTSVMGENAGVALIDPCSYFDDKDK